MRYALAILALAACGKSAPKAKPAVAVIGAERTPLVSVKAFAGDERGVVGLMFRFSAHDETCASIRDTTAPVVQFLVPAGPGDGYFVGRPIHLSLTTPERIADFIAGAPARDGEITLLELTPTSAEVQIDAQLGKAWELHGRFDVEVCDAAPKAGLPLDAPTGGVAGELHQGPGAGSYPLRFGTVLAQVKDGAVDWIEFFDWTDAPCGLQRETRKAILGYVPLAPVPGDPQPVRVEMPTDVDDGKDDRYLPGWIRLDAATPTELTFSVVVRRDAGEHFAGHLEGVLVAKICPAS